MVKSKSAIVRAKITYFFKETFRAHSKAEYREIFSRGLTKSTEGVTGAFPWLYVRAFFALFILFTINILILRLTNNTLFVPSVTFLGGTTFTIPFIILLFELYPKREISLFMLIAALVGGGTLACVLTQIGYAFIPVSNKWVSAVVAGVLEEICKTIPAIIIIMIFRQKNAYACFLFAAAVGAGFSVIEDMGYIFYYSDKYVFFYHSDIQATIAMFADRGLSSFCTHIVWTGAIGWSYSLSKRPLRSAGLVIFLLSIALHICWDLPFEGWVRALDITLCVIVAAVLNITIVHKSRIKTLEEEVNLTRLNDKIIREAKKMGELMRFRNAGNLTFSLTCTFLSVIVLTLCALPIGMEYTTENYSDKEEFIAFVQKDYNLKADWDREYDPEGHNIEERNVDRDDGLGLRLTYVIQSDRINGYDGEYFYGYFIYEDGTGEIDSLAVELENEPSRINCKEFEFGKEKIWVFEVNEALIDYTYNNLDGSILAVTDAEEFEGYELLIALCATGCAITISCAVILVSFKIKLGRLKDER